MAFVARQFGASEVILCGHHDPRLNLALKLGASMTLNTQRLSLRDEISKRFPNGISLIIDAVGDNSMLESGLDLLAPEGKLAIYGYTEIRNSKIDWSRAPVQWSIDYLVVPILRRLLEAHAPLVEQIMSGEMDLSEIVSHVIPFDQIQQAYELTKSRKAIKVVVQM